MWAIFKKKPISYFSAAEKEQICLAITAAEKRTSGEIRVFIESSCKPSTPISRAVAIFHELKMEETTARNGVLLYVAMNDKQLAVYGDEGIHSRVGEAFWQQEVNNMIAHFSGSQYLQGIISIVQNIGEALHTHFPYDEKGDKNELPNDIVFGD
ncbi:MAG: TPM domain-containing protein [Chitinophagia bacterium]|nr:TPM domain-containing protein [Chitinophagia bacterium]